MSMEEGLREGELGRPVPESGHTQVTEIAKPVKERVFDFMK